MRRSPARARPAGALAGPVRLPAAAVLAVLALGAPAPAIAGDTQDAVAARWKGAWVVTTAETQSDCAGLYTANRMNGRLVSSRGRVRFRAGELARVDAVDLKRDRVDLRLTFAEPVLAPRQEGPFTLYDEARCGVELEVEVGRQAVKSKDVRALDNALRDVVLRYATEEEARVSARYNGRQRDPYPPDYRETLRAHAAWRARQANAAVEARIRDLLDETSRIPERVTTDPDYLAGFARGVESGRLNRPDGCADLMAVGRAPVRLASNARGGGAARAAQSADAEADKRFTLGYIDGVRLVQGLDAVRRLPGCYVPVPGE